jgi:preprotein translocase subunit YajC
MLPFLVAFIAIMYFLVFRPNQKREKERRDMLASLSKGDRVVTTGGMCGTVVGLNEKTVILRVSEEPNVKIEFARGAVSRVTSHEGEDSR